MKAIFSTSNCYEGYNEKEDCWVIGGSYGDLANDPDIKESSIQWSDIAFDEEASYFKLFINELIQQYEKRYRTSVMAIGVIGVLGLWNGNPVGGKIIRSHQNPLLQLKNVDDIDVEIDDDGEIVLYAHHHDGTHTFGLYFLTENKLRKYAPNYLHWGDYTADDIESIYENLKPVKAGKIGISYYGDYRNQSA